MLMMALFILVILAGLGFALSRILSTSSDTIVNEVYGVRALQAAKSGLEIQLSEIFPIGSSVGVPSSCQTDSVFQPLAVPGLTNCAYLRRCQSQAYAAADIRLYQLSVTGACQAGDSVISRTLSVDAREGL
ncbi:hypothetical protein GCM10010982_26800 [Bowmanella pacifica]|uniref:MSHA biogenesis protein MshP n=2 Tax=Bowmanella pacifica TaxID=502051 RepID=A0A917YZW5_9ALTE|nr:hypothetical protein GCM10010982_26800 [Bowmanella pacifica]